MLDGRFQLVLRFELRFKRVDWRLTEHHAQPAAIPATVFGNT